jgi:5'-nucleotidase
MSQPPARGPIGVKILAINDLHGGLSAGQRVDGRPVGGAAYLAAHMKARAAASPHAFMVGAGDMYGASAPVSGLLREEPTVRVLNELGLLLNTPSNHEFDRGVDEFMRLNRGGCQPDLDCFEGARFEQISANIIDASTGLTLFPPYHIEQVEGVPIAFIGATLANVPGFTPNGAVDGLFFADPAIAINLQVRELEAQGVHTFIALIHEGGWLDAQSGQLTGPITRIVERLDPDVDLVLSAHTHQRYAVRHAGKLVTQGFSDSIAFVDADLTIDPGSGDVVESSAQVITTFDDEVAPDPAIQAIVAEAEAQTTPRTDRVVGVASRTLSKLEINSAGETPEGSLIADAQRWRTDADIALVNLFSIRGDIPAGTITWGDLYQAQAFANRLMTMTLSGEQLYELFEQQWADDAESAEEYRPLQVSGLRVTWRASRPRGNRIVSLTLPDGQPVRRADRYRVVANNFLASGGDGCLVMREGDDREVDLLEVEALADYLEQLPQPFDVRMEGRIVRLD